MSYQLLYLDIIRLLNEREEMPIEMIALKTGTTSSTVTELLEKLEQIHVVKLDNEKKNVKLAGPSSIPTMSEFYALAG
jgi:DNA-binding IclR family transcriptional regulator